MQRRICVTGAPRAHRLARRAARQPPPIVRSAMDWATLQRPVGWPGGPARAQRGRERWSPLALRPLGTPTQRSLGALNAGELAIIACLDVAGGGALAAASCSCFSKAATKARPRRAWNALRVPKNGTSERPGGPGKGRGGMRGVTPARARRRFGRRTKRNRERQRPPARAPICEGVCHRQCIGGARRQRQASGQLHGAGGLGPNSRRAGQAGQRRIAPGKNAVPQSGAWITPHCQMPPPCGSATTAQQSLQPPALSARGRGAAWLVEPARRAHAGCSSKQATVAAAAAGGLTQCLPPPKDRMPYAVLIGGAEISHLCGALGRASWQRHMRSRLAVQRPHLPTRFPPAA